MEHHHQFQSNINSGMHQPNFSYGSSIEGAGFQSFNSTQKNN
jgi:hypothetical protein